MHDVDGSSQGRTSPRPSFGDALPQDTRMAHNTNSTSYNPPGANPRTDRAVFNQNSIVWYDPSNNITSFYGVISSISTVPIQVIAKPGKDVFTDVLGITRPTGL